jgi:hypothetical protein
MCKTEKFFVSSIEDRLEGVSRDIQYLIDNHSKNKDKWIWFQAKLNDMSRLLNSIKEE